MQVVYIQESEVSPELIQALREKHGQGFGVVITCMAPPLPVLIEQHHEELVKVLALLERQPADEALLEQQRELSSTIDALQRAADRVSGVALDQPADGRTIAMRRAFDIRFGRDSRDTKAAPMEYLALWAAAWHAAELETMAYIGGAMVCNIDLEPALEASAAVDVKAIAENVCQRVAELPDRDSPADWPEAMLVTGPELIDVVTCEITQALASAPQAPAAPAMDALALAMGSTA